MLKEDSEHRFEPLCRVDSRLRSKLRLLLSDQIALPLDTSIHPQNDLGRIACSVTPLSKLSCGSDRIQSGQAEAHACLQRRRVTAGSLRQLVWPRERWPRGRDAVADVGPYDLVPAFTLVAR